MPVIAGLGTSFNLPNYGGELYTVTPSDTPFLSAIGGLNELGETTDSIEFEWQTQDLDEPEQPEHLEGNDAPSMEEETRLNVNNIVQIFHYSFGVSYTKQAATGTKSGTNNNQQNPVTDELTNQTNLKLEKAARDINYTFLRGSYQKPGNNATARKTRGLLSAISTNVHDNAGAVLTEVDVLDLLQAIWSTHGIRTEHEPTIITNATLKRSLTKLFITDKNYKEETREVGGVALTQLITDLGRVNIMIERNMPVNQLAVAHLRLCKPRFLLIPDKGFLFVEELAKVGASTKYQLYGEAGLQYGAEQAHGKLINVAPVPGA